MRLRVRAAGVNWADCAITRGVPYFLRMAYGLGGPRQPIRGMDVAGTVDRVGPGVRHLQVGDDVFGWSEGTFAEMAVAAEDPASCSTR